MAAMKAATEKWEAEIGLREDRVDLDEVDKILNMSRGVLNDLSAREAGENAFVLAQYAFVLQRRENQCRAFLRWANNHKHRVGMGSRDSFIFEAIEKCELRLDRIQYLSRRIEFMAERLKDLQYLKRREEDSK